jgi:PRTRC genetic system protein A
MANIAGYRILEHAGIYTGVSGIGYDYIMAGNGVYISASNQFISARIPVSSFRIRGLVDETVEIKLTHGKIPAILFELALNHAQSIHSEAYFAIVVQVDGYHIYYKPQIGGPGAVSYEKMANTICDIHSHIGIGPFFSDQDDRDEQGLRFSVVVGHLDKTVPSCRVRLGVYGYYYDMLWSDLFVGDLRNCIDGNTSVDDIIPDNIQRREEENVELHIEHGLRHSGSRRGWWDRIMSYRRPM